MKRSVFTLWIVFVIVLLMLIFLFYLTIPLLQNIQTKFIKSAEDILQQNQHVIKSIQNETIKQSLLNATNDQIKSLAEQQIILSTFTKYAWIFIIILAMLVVYILARRSVETSIIKSIIFLIITILSSNNVFAMIMQSGDVAKYELDYAKLNLTEGTWIILDFSNISLVEKDLSNVRVECENCKYYLVDDYQLLINSSATIYITLESNYTKNRNYIEHFYDTLTSLVKKHSTTTATVRYVYCEDNNKIYMVREYDDKWQIYEYNESGSWILLYQTTSVGIDLSLFDAFCINNKIFIIFDTYTSAEYIRGRVIVYDVKSNKVIKDIWSPFSAYKRSDPPLCSFSTYIACPYMKYIILIDKENIEFLETTYNHDIRDVKIVDNYVFLYTEYGYDNYIYITTFDDLLDNKLDSYITYYKIDEKIYEQKISIYKLSNNKYIIFVGGYKILYFDGNSITQAQIDCEIGYQFEFAELYGNLLVYVTNYIYIKFYSFDGTKCNYKFTYTASGSGLRAFRLFSDRYIIIGRTYQEFGNAEYNISFQVLYIYQKII